MSRRDGRTWRRAVALAISLLMIGCGRPRWAAPGESREPETKATVAVPATKIAQSGEASPPVSAWAVGLLGRSPREAFPNNGVCIGNADGITMKYSGPPAGSKIYGWGWDIAKKRHVDRVILVDKDYLIVGAGEGGEARPDVVRTRPDVTDRNTGWKATTAKTAGPVDVFGVVGSGVAICPLGHLEL